MDSTEAALTALDAVMAAGGEGLMLRHSDLVCQPGRTARIVKLTAWTGRQYLHERITVPVRFIGNSGLKWRGRKSDLISLAKALVAGLSEAQLAAIRLRNTLSFAFGSAASGAEAFKYVTALANRLGLELNATAEGYAKFSVAAQASGLSVSQSNAVFESVSKAVATLGLTADDANGVFLALSQMLSKGKRVR